MSYRWKEIHTVYKLHCKLDAFYLFKAQKSFCFISPKPKFLLKTQLHSHFTVLRQNVKTVSFCHTWTNEDINGYGQNIKSTTMNTHHCALVDYPFRLHGQQTYTHTCPMAGSIPFPLEPSRNQPGCLFWVKQERAGLGCALLTGSQW